jgi:hypothetical protein
MFRCGWCQHPHLDMIFSCGCWCHPHLEIIFAASSRSLTIFRRCAYRTPTGYQNFPRTAGLRVPLAPLLARTPHRPSSGPLLARTHPDPLLSSPSCPLWSPTRPRHRPMLCRASPPSGCVEASLAARTSWLLPPAPHAATCSFSLGPVWVGLAAHAPVICPCHRRCQARLDLLPIVHHQSTIPTTEHLSCTLVC